MCGLTGLFRCEDRGVSAADLDAMTELVRHRGPDGSGRVFLDTTGPALAETPPAGSWRVALGHRRLKILDLSDAALQPMTIGDGLWLVYNGEVYNYLELRAELESEGHRFRTSGDTEVILAAWAQWGPSCFGRFCGMWGLLLIDGRRRRAILCRDRLGIKPLYLWAGDGFLAVVSELKQLTALGGVTLAANGDALGEYLDTGYEDPDRCFLAGVRPVPAGTWIEIDLDTLAVGEPVSYWHPERVTSTISDPATAADAFAEALRGAVALHLRSDVPVGCALSGGLDSSAVAALIQEGAPASGARLLTFTARFPGSSVDEGAQVERTAAALGTRSHFVEPRPEKLLAELDRFVWSHDEPVGSLSQYAGFCVARLTRAHGVPVVLNGQGGDEVLGGYWQSYLMYLRQLGRGGHVVELARHLLGALLPGGNRELLRQLPILGRRYLHRRRATAGRPRATDELMGLDERARRLFEIRRLHLPRLLKWDDRNFMAFSVEGRYPFLDHRLIELCLSFRPKTLYRAGWTKMPLRRGLAGVLPEEVRRRRIKLGFETPQERWLAGALAGSLQAFASHDSPLWSWIEPARVQRLAAAVRAGGDRETHEELLRCFLADRWLRRFRL